ncbi:tRNA pseudouridine(55) synthase TruB [Patescibacteria group bacterium]
MADNIVIIDKPKGITSHDVVDAVRKKTGERRVGHAGTLDPLATGVLIVLVGRGATKRQAEFMGLPKEYEAELMFGTTSETYDAEGPLTQTADAEQLGKLTQTDVEATLPQFIGTIQQRPPAHSAIKVGGRPLYKKARKGEVQAADIPERTVQIDSIELLSFTPATPTSPPQAHLRIACQKGVYIRSLAHDIGQLLEVGAYLSKLARTKIGPHTLATAVSLEEFLKQ